MMIFCVVSLNNGSFQSKSPGVGTLSPFPLTNVRLRMLYGTTVVSKSTSGLGSLERHSEMNASNLDPP